MTEYDAERRALHAAAELLRRHADRWADAGNYAEAHRCLDYAAEIAPLASTRLPELLRSAEEREPWRRIFFSQLLDEKLGISPVGAYYGGDHSDDDD